MLAWMKPRRRGAHNRTEPEAEAATGQGSVLAGRSAPLYKYLNERYANTVVLTFAEIEDLLGFALPDLARLSSGWWTTADPDAGSSFSDSWVLANRTARPNLPALTVVFDRAS